MINSREINSREMWRIHRTSAPRFLFTPGCCLILLLLPIGCRDARHQDASHPNKARPDTAESVSPRPSIRPATEGASKVPLPAADSAPPEARDWPVRFHDVTQEAGIDFRHTDGSSGRRYVIESMTGGVALFDYDGDGLLDIYFLNGSPLDESDSETVPTNKLYRNEGNWRFTDVTEEAGVGDTGYGLGVCVGDFDNDGFPDIYVNNFGANVLYKNRGDGTFVDVTDTAGVTNGDRVGAGAAFLDINGDGNLDLYVANYLQFSLEDHRPHTRRGIPAYPSPLSYHPDPDTLYRNNGDGTFTDVSVESGIAEHAGNSMGVVCLDFDNDGHTDIFVANDQMANFLFRNDGNGRFEEVALQAGAALDFGGHPQATMGVDAGDFDNNGLIDLHTTSFAGEPATLYRDLGGGLFEDATRATAAGDGTFPHVTWGNCFADFDNDGFRDLFVACGHLEDNLELHRGSETTAYRVPNILLRNSGRGSFVDVSRSSGPAFAAAFSSRGAAVGDLDNDGNQDIVVLNSRQQPSVLRNDSASGHRWVKVRLCGVRSNRSGIGARVTVVAGDLRQVSEIHSGRGYQSHFGDPLTFGLGESTEIDLIEVRWPRGTVDSARFPPQGRVVTFVESR